MHRERAEQSVIAEDERNAMFFDYKCTWQSLLQVKQRLKQLHYAFAVGIFGMHRTKATI